MATGLLEIQATLKLAQCWSKGGSDADTSDVIVQTAPYSFQFTPHPGTPRQIRPTLDPCDGEPDLPPSLTRQPFASDLSQKLTGARTKESLYADGTF
jgi:hypothetical protein